MTRRYKYTKIIAPAQTAGRADGRWTAVKLHPDSIRRQIHLRISN
ncbi:MAG: hypothetical protein RMM53_10245 [Bacteroidia bacterium]|nr:hypothetical protein [Bacteroidia bacterium]MDW8334583.1 hypothetical protein [Bacteroidia bacterium]